MAGFLPVVAPASVAGWTSGRARTRREEEFVYAVADVLRVEYQAIIDAGLILQVDDAYLPWTYDLMVPPATMEDYRAWAQLRIDALNHALRGLPEERVPLPHLLGQLQHPARRRRPRRATSSTWCCRSMRARTSSRWPTHATSTSGACGRTSSCPTGKVLIPGVIGHSTNVVEHPELVAERLTRLARLVGRENVLGGTDCGFSQGPFTPRVHESIQWAKLRSLSEGAGLATRELWGTTVAA